MIVKTVQTGLASKGDHWSDVFIPKLNRGSF